MKIRKAKKEDLDEIDKIYVEGSIDEGKLQFPDVSKKEMIKEMSNAKKERLKGFRKELVDSKNYWVVAVDEGETLGIGHAWLKTKDIGMIEKVYVSKEHRRKGVGLRIAKKLIRWLKKNKVKYIESSIYWGNKPSIKLNEKLGFKPISLKMRLK
jgi:L-amino acid N-acyltransferase YncA